MQETLRERQVIKKVKNLRVKGKCCSCVTIVTLMTVLVVFGLGAPSKFSPSILGSGVGGHAAREAGKLGMTVRAVARNPDKYSECFKDSPGVTLVKGDVTDAESVAECLKDANACIFAVQAADGVSAMAIDRDAAILVAKECAKVNCKFILISSVYVSAKHRFNPLRMILNTFVKWNMMDAKLESEEAIRKMQGLRYTIIRPGSLVDKPAVTNEYKIGQGDRLSFPTIPIPKVDVGKVAVACVTDPESDNVTFELAGSSSKNVQTVTGLFSKLKKD